jgi:prepilin-type N-terminal cleavage/methylation domain-containing protein
MLWILGLTIIPIGLASQNTIFMNILKFSRFKSAFTLVELLTVIAIIGILAAMLLTVFPAVIKTGKITKAKLEMADIVNAIEAYDSDYGRFPISSSEQSAAGTNDFTVGAMLPLAPISLDNNSNVVAILMDLTVYPNGTPTANVGHAKNSKQVKYLNAKISGYDPASNNPNPPGGVDNNGIYRDPWGSPYVITMNTSRNEQGTSDILYSLRSVSQNPPASTNASGFNGLVNPIYSANPNNFLFHGKVMVWSAGPDKQYGTMPANTGINKDNVLSWQ